MASLTQRVPGLVSTPRITVLLAALLVSVGSGTNYVYSAYAPQLGARLHITYTQLSVIGLAGNVGVYIGAPIWGKIVDARGPRLPLAGASILLLAGYFGIRRVYDAGVPTSDSTLPTLDFYTLIFCGFMTGLGGIAGSTSSTNATAKTFPDNARGLTTGLVISGFGLSAFLFSAISHLAFAGNTSSFLLLLSIGTAFPMIVGFFLVQPIPLPPSESMHGLENGIVETRFRDATTSEASASSFYHEPNSRSHLLSMGPPMDTMSSNQIDISAPSPEFAPPHTTNWRESSRNSSARRSSGSREPKRTTHFSHVSLPNISGWALLVTWDFWLLSSILSLLSGTGIMYINNVGSMSQALFAKANPSYDETEASRWQAAQVSSISIMNFLGRIFIGIASDFARNKLKVPRSYCLMLVSFFYLISQITAANVDDIRHLWIPSALLGLAHGSVFSLLPTLCIEWFGMPHFSETWGYLMFSPMFSGYLFSVVFGRNLDAHAPSGTQTLLGKSAPEILSASPRCLEGRECYSDALYLTMTACSLAGVLSIVAGWSDRKKMLAAELRVSGIAGSAWEDPDD